jgi:hypothetical protein
MDEELTEIRARMEELALWMQQDAKPHWVYEWPIKRRVKWPVQYLLARRQWRLLKEWLRHIRSLSDREGVVHTCEPETGRNLSDVENEMRSLEDLIDCQVGNRKFPICQVGREKEMRLFESLGSSEVSSCQQGVLMEMGSIDLIDCQVGSRKIPYCQVGKGEQMNSEVSSYQQEELTEKEGQKSILMIGGIRVFLPNSPVEANTSVAHEGIVQQESEKEAMGPNDFKVNCVCDAGTKKERQPSETVMMKEKISEAAQGKEEEHTVKMLTPWEKELEMLEDWLNHPEPVDECHEKTVMEILREEHSEKLLENFSQGAEQMITAVSRHATEDEGEFQSEEQLEEAGIQPAQGEMAEASLSEKMTEQQISQEDKTAELNFAAGWQVEATEEEDSLGDRDDLPICREEVQWSMLQKESHPWEQLDEEIENIRRLMSRSAAETASEEELSRGEPAIAAGQQMQQQQRSSGADGQLQRTVWDPGGFQQAVLGSS